MFGTDVSNSMMHMYTRLMCMHIHTVASTLMGREVLEGLRVSRALHCETRATPG